MCLLSLYLESNSTLQVDSEFGRNKLSGVSNSRLSISFAGVSLAVECFVLRLRNTNFFIADFTLFPCLTNALTLFLNVLTKFSAESFIVGCFEGA